MKVILIALALCSLATSAFAFEGLVVTDLSPGGDVTVPGSYPIRVPRKVNVVFTGLSTPQTMTLTNQAQNTSIVNIYSGTERAVRRIRLNPGTSAVYSLKIDKPVRVQVVEGDVRVNSILPLKVQR